MKKWCVFLSLMLLMGACQPKQSNELEAITADVLKKGQGVDIEFKPIPKEK